MSLLSLESVCFAFGETRLLDKVDLTIAENERIGLIGRNGAGKSTMLKIIAGLKQADSGNIRVKNGLRIAMVTQEPELEPGKTVYECVSDGLGNIRDLINEYHKTTSLLEQKPHDDKLLNQLHRLQSGLEASDGWQVSHLIDSIISRMQLDPDARVDALSGGQRKRLALAQSLVIEPDLLILDEPTNHLDIESIQWLEELLNNFKGSILFITHDRRFLDDVATRIIELDIGHLYSFPGNFSEYQRRKADQLETESRQNAEFDKFLKGEEEWIRQGIKARRTRNEGRVRRLEALRKERRKRRERTGNIRLAIDEGQLSGKIVAELEHVSYSWNEQALIKDFSTLIIRGDRIGLIGPNGVGKTTLLNIILGKIKPDQGTVRTGTKLSVAYFDQFRDQLNPDDTLVEAVASGSDYVHIGEQKLHIMSYLANFLFSPQRSRDKVSSLSGGERNRLLLARMFTQASNVLVLDEPTNDLDIETLELLESTLQDYQGTVLLVSHDREFLENTCTQVIAFDGNGKLSEFTGGYDDWIRNRQNISQQEQANSIATRKTKPGRKPGKLAKLSYKEQRELDELPDKIEHLELELEDISSQLADGSLFRDEPETATQLQKRYEETSQRISESMMRWEQLEAQRDKFTRQSD
jgi:ATP-binding cassette subfamily F protein uup